MTDPEVWFLTQAALDYRATVSVLNRASGDRMGEAVAGDLAAALARAGYALVDLASTRRVPTCEMTPTFVDRTED